MKLKNKRLLILLILCSCYVSSRTYAENGLSYIFEALGSGGIDLNKLDKPRVGEVKEGVLYVNAITLDWLKPYDTFNSGTVSSIGSITAPFTKSGQLSYIIGEGSFIFGNIPQEGVNGDRTVNNGTVIASIKKDEAEREYNKAKERKNIIIKSSKYIESITAAQQALAKKKYISSFDMDAIHLNLMKSVLEYKSKLYDLNETIHKYQTPNIYSNYSGIITNTLARVGDEVFEGSPAVELMKMDTVLVKVKCPTMCLNIDSGNEYAYVYPAKSERPIKAAIQVRQNDPYYLYIYINNKTVSTNELTRRQKKLKKVFTLFPIQNLLKPEINPFNLPTDNIEDVVTVVPIDALRKDDGGYYVFKTIRDSSDINKLSVNSLRIKKVYIKLGNIVTTISAAGKNSMRVQSIISEGSSSEALILPGDIVVGDAEAGLKDGMEVIKIDIEWLFYPGNNVRVSIPQYAFPGIFIPSSSIIHESKNNNYIYIIEHNTLKLIKVNVVGFYRNYCIINGEGITKGVRALLLDEESLNNISYDKIYSGRKIAVVETKDAPKFIENPHVFNYLGQYIQIKKINTQIVPNIKKMNQFEEMQTIRGFEQLKEMFSGR